MNGNKCRNVDKISTNLHNLVGEMLLLQCFWKFNLEASVKCQVYTARILNFYEVVRGANVNLLIYMYYLA